MADLAATPTFSSRARRVRKSVGINGMLIEHPTLDA
jgi:hypothetical protein